MDTWSLRGIWGQRSGVTPTATAVIMNDLPYTLKCAFTFYVLYVCVVVHQEDLYRESFGR